MDLMLVVNHIDAIALIPESHVWMHVLLESVE